MAARHSYAWPIVNKHVWRWTIFIKLSQKFEGIPIKFGGPKHWTFRAISDNFSNIWETQQDVVIRKRRCKLRSLPHTCIGTYLIWRTLTHKWRKLGTEFRPIQNQLFVKMSQVSSVDRDLLADWSSSNNFLQIKIRQKLAKIQYILAYIVKTRLCALKSKTCWRTA